MITAAHTDKSVFDYAPYISQIQCVIISYVCGKYIAKWLISNVIHLLQVTSLLVRVRDTHTRGRTLLTNVDQVALR